MQRKLVRQGVNALTITLPHHWIKDRGLQAGDIIDVETKDSSLLITSDTLPHKKEAILEIKSDDSRYIQYLLNNYYRSGYDKITLKGNISQKQLHESLKLLMGFSISESKNEIITIENLTEPAIDNVDVILKQIFFIIKQDFKEIIDNITRGIACDFTSISINSERAVMNSNLCLRLFSKKVKETNGFYWMITNLVTWVHRQLYYLVKNIGRKKILLKKEEFIFLQDVALSFDYLYDGIFKKSFEQFHQIHDIYNRYEHKRIKLFSSTSSSSAVIIQRFLQIHEFIFRATSSGIGIVSLNH